MSTFAQELKESTEYTNRLMSQAHDLMERAKVFLKEGDKTSHFKLLGQAEELLEKADRAFKQFELEHVKELKAIRSLIKE